MYIDKYRLSCESNLLLARRCLTESVYDAMRMDNRKVNLAQTKSILDGYNVENYLLDDIQAILDMRDAWEYVLDHVDETLDIEYLCELHKRVAYHEGQYSGKLRIDSTDQSGLKRVSPSPDRFEANSKLSDFMGASLSKTEIAINVFSWIAQGQLFGNGNKRTALLAANKILIENGSGILLVPETFMLEFSEKLNSYRDIGGAMEFKSFLYEASVQGMDASLSFMPQYS